MSLRAALFKRLATRIFTNPPAHAYARFSTCARIANPPATIDEPDAPPKPSSRRDEQSNKNSNGGSGLAFPALALFAIGAPLGWYMKKQLERISETRIAGPHEFVKYTLAAKDDVSSTSAIFRLKPSTNVTLDLDNPLLERAITSIELKQPQLQVARSYTCLPQETGQHMDELRFLIRKQDKGEVSNYLHKLPAGSEIEVRGLRPEYILPDDVKSAVFVVGGTGIAPAMQAVDIFDGQAHVHILWASRKREECIGGTNDTKHVAGFGSWWSRTISSTVGTNGKIARANKGVLVSLLDSLKQQSASSSYQLPRLSIDYFVDEEGNSIRPEEVKAAITGSSQHDSTGKQIVFVSGPEGFMNYWAGPKQWMNGREMQGPLRGVLSTMDLQGWEVVKL